MLDHCFSDSVEICMVAEDQLRHVDGQLVDDEGGRPADSSMFVSHHSKDAREDVFK